LLSDPEAVDPEGPSVAVAVLTSGSVTRLAENATGTENASVAAPPPGITALVALNDVWPAAPVTAPQFAPPPATQVTVPVSVTPAGNASVTVTLSALVAPVFVTVTT